MGTPYLKMRILSLFPCSHIPSKMDQRLEGSEAGSNRLHRKIPYNPFLNVLILENILNSFGPADQLKLRLVCKLWNEEIVKIFHTSETPLQCKNIESDKDAHKFTKTIEGSENFPANKFSIEIPKITPTFNSLFRSLGFQQSVVTLEVMVSSSDFPKLLENVSYLCNLINLKIHRVPEESVQNLFTTRDGYSSSLIAPKLDKLRSISFRNSYPKKRFLGSYTQYIVDFLKRSENLQFLEFHYWSSSLTRIFREAPLTKLTELNVKGKTLGHNDVSLLMSKNLQFLKSIHVIVDRHVAAELVEAFLQSYSKSLTYYNVIMP